MNTQPGIFGRKLGNTQLFEQDGSVTRVTVIEAGPVTVVSKRTPEKDGYTALVYGSLAAATALYSKLPFDTINDFAPVVPFGQQPLAIVAPPGRFKDLPICWRAPKRNRVS